MKWSSFGERFTRHTGSRELMEDLGAAMACDDPPLMLGGGNPAQIPEMLELFRREFARVLASDREFRRMVADYAEPAGERRFRAALSELLQREYGWAVTPREIALTAGSQQGFFQLFNLLAGTRGAGDRRRILLPVTPEYIGYKDLGVDGDLFVSRRPVIEELPQQQFKYHVDFSSLQVAAGVAVICISRPTNPTGNVLTDAEVRGLGDLAAAGGVPLIIDAAYGAPFPRIVFTEVRPYWDENVILCLSLSKLGLPAVRSGIIIARAEIADAIASMNATMSLAVSSVGPVLLRELVASGAILRISDEVIRPFYERRSRQALDWLHEALHGCPYRVHRPEGAFFLWLWLPGLPMPSEQLYRRLKERGVLVLPGHHFFPGLSEDWPHRHECIRISYTQQPEVVKTGIAIIGEEVRRSYGA